MLEPVGIVLNGSGSLGQARLSPKKTFRSPVVDLLMPQGNIVVMIDGVASDLVVKGRGMAPSPSPTKVTSSNTFAILDSTTLEDGISVPAIELEMGLESTVLEDGTSVLAIEKAPISPLLEECSASSDLVPLVTKMVKGKGKGK